MILKFEFPTLYIGLLYLIFALPKDKVESMEVRPLSEVWYPGMFSARMSTLVANHLSTKDPSKTRRTQSERKVKKVGVEKQIRNMVSVA